MALGLGRSPAGVEPFGAAVTKPSSADVIVPVAADGDDQVVDRAIVDDHMVGHRSASVVVGLAGDPGPGLVLGHAAVVGQPVQSLLEWGLDDEHLVVLAGPQVGLDQHGHVEHDDLGRGIGDGRGDLDVDGRVGDGVEIGQGLGAERISFPNHLGIAGTVFTTGESVNIPHAYADLRFNPGFDKKTGFSTRSILCVPVNNKDGKNIGVTQVLNKRGGPFTAADETRLIAFTAQIAICLENAKLFDDVQNMKNYNESMLESMSNGVITMDEEGMIVTCNGAGMRIMQVEPAEVLGKQAHDFFEGANAWLLDRIKKVEERVKPMC